MANRLDAKSRLVAPGGARFQTATKGEDPGEPEDRVAKAVIFPELHRDPDHRGPQDRAGREQETRPARRNRRQITLRSILPVIRTHLGDQSMVRIDLPEADPGQLRLVAHRRKAGLGTLIATMVPYSVIFMLGWMLLFTIWAITGFPLPGTPMEYVPAG